MMYAGRSVEAHRVEKSTRRFEAAHPMEVGKGISMCTSTNAFHVDRRIEIRFGLNLVRLVGLMCKLYEFYIGYIEIAKG